MKKFVFFSVIAALLLAGCAREAYYADREFGKDSTAAFDRMIINKDMPHAGKAPEGLDGIHAEPVMSGYQETFSDNLSRQSIDITGTGL